MQKERCFYNQGGPITQRSVTLWDVRTGLGDMFGQPAINPLSAGRAVELICWGRKEGLIELTSAHDDDLVPWDPKNPNDDQDQSSQTYQALCALKDKLAEAGVEFHTMTCNLHANMVFKNGGLANADPFAINLATQKVQRAIRIGAFLGARVFTYWVARDGWIVPVTTRFESAYQQIAEALNGARDYILKQGYTNYEYGTIEPKPNEPTGHSFIPTAGHAAGFITSLLIKDPNFWKVNPELNQHEGMCLLDPVTCVAYLIAIGKLGFLHLGNQIKGHEDNDYPLLVGPEGLKETISMFWALKRCGWNGVGEFDCHPLREDARLNDEFNFMKDFIRACSRGLAISLLLAERLEEASRVKHVSAMDADLASIAKMCGLSDGIIESAMQPQS